jgi:hypothetical protein
MNACNISVALIDWVVSAIAWVQQLPQNKQEQEPPGVSRTMCSRCSFVASIPARRHRQQPLLRW